VPKLWETTIDRHRETVRDAILGAAAALAVERGLTAVTMSAVAERAGIGRATLYKYFSDVESILIAGHERHVESHLEELTVLRDAADDPETALRSVASAYARICLYRQRHGSPDVSALVHRGDHAAHAERRLTDLFTDLLAALAATGGIRDDLAPDELAAYCLHALAAAGRLGDEAAAERLADLTVEALLATA
jgi:AcrR family transcriptional regulator